MKWALVIIISYLIGCFSSAYFIGKITKNIDIRGYGSGNAGTTNAMRVMGGKKLGIVTFVLDVFKGILAVYLGRLLLGDTGGLVGGDSLLLWDIIGLFFSVLKVEKGGWQHP